MSEAERREAIRRTLLNRTEAIRRERAEQIKAVISPERIDELAARGGQPFSDLYRILVPKVEEEPE